MRRGVIDPVATRCACQPVGGSHRAPDPESTVKCGPDKRVSAVRHKPACRLSVCRGRGHDIRAIAHGRHVTRHEVNHASGSALTGSRTRAIHRSQGRAAAPCQRHRHQTIARPGKRIEHDDAITVRRAPSEPVSAADAASSGSTRSRAASTYAVCSAQEASSRSNLPAARCCCQSFAVAHGQRAVVQRIPRTMRRPTYARHRADSVSYAAATVGAASSALHTPQPQQRVERLGGPELRANIPRQAAPCGLHIGPWIQESGMSPRTIGMDGLLGQQRVGEIGETTDAHFDVRELGLLLGPAAATLLPAWAVRDCRRCGSARATCGRASRQAAPARCHSLRRRTW